MPNECEDNFYGDAPPTTFTFGRGQDYAEATPGASFTDQSAGRDYGYDDAGQWTLIHTAQRENSEVGDAVIISEGTGGTAGEGLSCIRLGLITATGTVLLDYTDDC